MRDDEWEVWRRQWQGQPNEVVDLIRRVERETVEMRMGRLVLWAPVAVASALTLFIAIFPTTWGILFAVGLWLIMGFTKWFLGRNHPHVWAPDAETTTAYLELSIRRCRSADFRAARWVIVLIPAFVLVGVYGLLQSMGVFKNAVGYWIFAATALWIIALVGFLLFGLHRATERKQLELDYLLDLQRRLSQQGNGN